LNTLKNNHLQITHLKQATQKHPYIINKEKEKEKNISSTEKEEEEEKEKTEKCRERPTRPATSKKLHNRLPEFERHVMPTSVTPIATGSSRKAAAFAAASPGVCRNVAPHLSGKPQGNRTQSPGNQ